MERFKSLFHAFYIVLYINRILEDSSLLSSQLQFIVYIYHTCYHSKVPHKRATIKKLRSNFVQGLNNFKYKHTAFHVIILEELTLLPSKAPKLIKTLSMPGGGAEPAPLRLSSITPKRHEILKRNFLTLILHI